MSDISFSGLGSFVLFLFTCILFGLIIVVLLIRQFLLYQGSTPRSVRANTLLIKASLCPFVASIGGLMALEIFRDPPTQRQFDQYLSFMIIGVGLLVAMIWLIAGLQQLNRQFK